MWAPVFPVASSASPGDSRSPLTKVVVFCLSSHLRGAQAQPDRGMRVGHWDQTSSLRWLQWQQRMACILHNMPAERDGCACNRCGACLVRGHSTPLQVFSDKCSDTFLYCTNCLTLEAVRHKFISQVYFEDIISRTQQCCLQSL